MGLSDKLGFLREFRAHIFAEHLDEQGQSVLAEVGFWMVLYAVYSNVLSKVLRKVLPKFTFWEQAAKHSGTFAYNAQDDIIVFLVLAVHHGIAGSMMLSAAIHSDSLLWRHGYLMETGFELYDLVAFAQRWFPYTDYMKKSTELVMMMHHLPGLSLAIPIITKGLYKSRNLQVIGGSLLFAGAVSVFVGALQHTIDRKQQKGLAAFMQVFTLVFYTFARLVVFPIAFMGFLDDVAQENHSDILQLAVKAGGAMMSIFNIVIFLDLVPKAFRYVKYWWTDGSSTLESGAVPPSRAQQESLDRSRTSKKNQ